MRVGDNAPLRVSVPGRDLSAAVSLNYRIRDPNGVESTLAAAAGSGVTDETLGVLAANEYAEALFAPDVPGNWRFYLVEVGDTQTRSTQVFRFVVGQAFP